MDKEEKLEKLTVRVSKEKKAMMLKALGKSSYDSLSDFMRAGIDKELNVQMYKDSLDFIIKELDTMIDAKLAPLIKAERKNNGF